MLYGKLKKHLGEEIRELCRQRGIELVEGHLMPDHIHKCVSIPSRSFATWILAFKSSTLKVNGEQGVTADAQAPG